MENTMIPFDSPLNLQDDRVRFYVERRQYLDAILELDHLLGAIPRTPPKVVRFGTEKLLAGEWPLAQRYFTNIVTGNPSYDWAFFGRGVAYAHLEQPDLAQQDFSQALRVAENRQLQRSMQPYGKISALYGHYRRAILWAAILDLPLYHLALGQAETAQQLCQTAAEEAPRRLLEMAQEQLATLGQLLSASAAVPTLTQILADGVAKRAGEDLHEFGMSPGPGSLSSAFPESLKAQLEG